MKLLFFLFLASGRLRIGVFNSFFVFLELIEQLDKTPQHNAVEERKSTQIHVTLLTENSASDTMFLGGVEHDPTEGVVLVMLQLTSQTVSGVVGHGEGIKEKNGNNNRGSLYGGTLEKESKEANDRSADEGNRENQDAVEYKLNRQDGQ